MFFKFNLFGSSFDVNNLHFSYLSTMYSNHNQKSNLVKEKNQELMEFSFIFEFILFRTVCCPKIENLKTSHKDILQF